MFVLGKPFHSGLLGLECLAYQSIARIRKLWLKFLYKTGPRGKTLKKDKMRVFKLKLTEKVWRKKVFFNLIEQRLIELKLQRTKSVKTKFD